MDGIHYKKTILYNNLQATTFIIFQIKKITSQSWITQSLKNPKGQKQF